MSPIQKNRKPAPYKDKGGQTKQLAVAFRVTDSEMQALEILCKDWNISIAQAVRTMIGLAGGIAELNVVFQQPKSQELLKKSGIEPSELEWRLITLKRFHKYWSNSITSVNK